MGGGIQYSGLGCPVHRLAQVEDSGSWHMKKTRGASSVSLMGFHRVLLLSLPQEDFYHFLLNVPGELAPSKSP